MVFRIIKIISHSIHFIYGFTYHFLYGTFNYTDNFIGLL